MTPRTEITFGTPRRHGWKDTLVVAFLLIVLGAFVAQLVKPAPSTSRAPDTTAASQACLDARC